MRKIIYAVSASLDGYIARPDGSLDFLHLAPSNYSMMPFFKTIDVGLMGRKTYDVGVRMSGGKFESHGLCCYIFSRSLPGGETRRSYFCPQRTEAICGGVAQEEG
jgi:dihydrofolate reductase